MHLPNGSLRDMDTELSSDNSALTLKSMVVLYDGGNVISRIFMAPQPFILAIVKQKKTGCFVAVLLLGGQFVKVNGNVGGGVQGQMRMCV